MKRKVTNLSKIMLWGGLTFLFASFVLLQVDSQTGWLLSKISKTKALTTQAQVREQRLVAINDAIANGKNSYRFEVPGANILTMPMLPGEGAEQK